jgi:chloride channel 7
MLALGQACHLLFFAAAAAAAVTGDETIKHLVSRGAHRRFSYQSLMVMLAWYFLGAAVAAGSAISSGLFVPMLM